MARISLPCLALCVALQFHFVYAKRMGSGTLDLAFDLESVAEPDNSTTRKRLADDEVVNDEKQMCRSVLSKLVKLIKFDEKLGINDTDEEQIMTDLMSAISSPETTNLAKNWLDRIQDIESLSMLNPELALEADEVITISDLNILNSCAGDKKLPYDLHALEKTDDGAQIIEGDIVVPPAGSLLQQNESRGNSSFGSDSQWAGSLWKDGVVPWCFHVKTDPKVKETFRRVVSELQKRTCLRFKKVSVVIKTMHNRDQHCVESPSIIVQSHEKGCWSYVGDVKVTGSQKVNLHHSALSTCATHGITAHEIGHAIGMEHEQSRPDRDKFVTIHWGNIPLDKRHNFQIKEKAYAGDRYDYFSLMHYGQNDFSFDSRYSTITSKNPAHNRILGQRVGFSNQDILQINRMYQCKIEKGADNAERWCMGSSLIKEPGAKCHAREFCLQCQSVADPGLPSCTELRKTSEHVALDITVPCRGPHTRNCLCHLRRVPITISQAPSWSNLWNGFGISGSETSYSTTMRCNKTTSKVFYNRDGSICTDKTDPELKKKDGVTTILKSAWNALWG